MAGCLKCVNERSCTLGNPGTGRRLLELPGNSTADAIPEYNSTDINYEMTRKKKIYTYLKK